MIISIIFMSKYLKVKCNGRDTAWTISIFYSILCQFEFYSSSICWSFVFVFIFICRFYRFESLYFSTFGISHNFLCLSSLRKNWEEDILKNTASTQDSVEAKDDQIELLFELDFPNLVYTVCENVQAL